MNFMEMAKQLKNMQHEAKKIKSDLAQEKVIGTGGRGAVSVTLNGALEIQSVTIDPKSLEHPNVKELELAVREAMASAIRQAQKIAASRVSHLTGGLNQSPF